MIWLLYAAYAWLAPALPLSWPVPPLDLVLVGAAASRVRAVRLVLGFALIDGLLGSPEPWARWALRVVVALGWQHGPLFVLAAVFGCYVLLGPGGGLAHLWLVLASSALLAWRLQPPAAKARRRWGWHE